MVRSWGKRGCTCQHKVRKILQPVARKVGIKKQIGWHTFRRTYSSLLAETGNDVKVVQELMRHSKLSTTMEVYAQAGMTKKRAAQRRAVDALFNRDSEASRGGEASVVSHYFVGNISRARHGYRLRTLSSGTVSVPYCDGPGTAGWLLRVVALSGSWLCGFASR